VSPGRCCYAVLSLTVVRMVPVFRRLIGTRRNTADRLFIGLFGPRGLATIVFAVLVLGEKLPGNDTMILAAGWTVLLGVSAHGVTATPLAKRSGRVPLLWAKKRRGSGKMLAPAH
jgi:sodium/hydrogen antiporter